MDLDDKYQFNNKYSIQMNEISVKEEDDNVNDNYDSNSVCEQMEIDDDPYFDKHKKMKIYNEPSELKELSTNLSMENLGLINNENDLSDEDCYEDSQEDEYFEEEEEKETRKIINNYEEEEEESVDDSLGEYQKELIEEGYNEIYEDIKDAYNDDDY